MRKGRSFRNSIAQCAIAALPLGVLVAAWCSSVAWAQRPPYGPCSPVAPCNNLPLSDLPGARNFCADGRIDEFVRVGNTTDSQNYFEAAGGPDLGHFVVGANLSPGVFEALDVNPAVPPFEAGPTGFADRPGSDGNTTLPTGFNIGRFFVSYNPALDAYFVAMDVSAPAALDPLSGTETLPFDVDGDGSLCTVTEITPDCTSEAPTKGDDVYRVSIDLDQDGILDITIEVGETFSGDGLPVGAIAINPDSHDYCDNLPLGVVRYVTITALGASIPVGERVAWRNFHLGGDPNVTPGVVCIHDVVGIGDGMNRAGNGPDPFARDVEIMIRNVSQQAPGVTSDPFFNKNFGNACCARFLAFVDSNNDECLGGGAEDSVTVTLAAPCPDIEVTKLVRCVSPTSDFTDRVEIVPGARVEFQVTVQNWGNIPLAVDLTDTLNCTPPATVTLVPNSVAVTVAPAGFNGAGFRAAFAAAFRTGGFTMPNVVTLASAPGQNCSGGLGEELVFTFQVDIGPADAGNNFCNTLLDCSNDVSVIGRGTTPVNPIPDGEEPAGGIPDEYFPEVRDDANVIDTIRETAAGDDDNRAEINILCRRIVFRKEVALVTGGVPGPFFSGDNALIIPTGPGPFIVEYRYVVENNGEVTESFTITDPILCADLAIPGDGVAFIAGQCSICQNGSAVVVVPPGGSNNNTRCRVQFDTLAALRAFLLLDDNRDGVPPGEPNCRATRPNGTGDPFCYRNCASACARPSLAFAEGDTPPPLDPPDRVPPDEISDGPDERERRPVPPIEIDVPIEIDDTVIPPTDSGVPIRIAGQVVRPAGVTPRCDCPVPCDLCRDAFATICNRPCEIEVLKEVRCLDNCTPIVDPLACGHIAGYTNNSTSCEAAGFGPQVSDLDVAPGSCVQWRVSIRNITQDPLVGLCALRLDDVISDINDFIPGSISPSVIIRRTDRPADVLVANPPIDWHSAPQAPGARSVISLNPPLPVGACVVLTFRAQLNGPAGVTADTDPRNFMSVECAGECPGGVPAFEAPTCDSEAIDVLSAAYRCQSKQWSVQWDQNGDCQPDNTADAFADELDLSCVVFPAILKLRIRVENTGQTCVSVTAADANFVNHAQTTPGVSIVEPATCELVNPTPKTICPGGTADWFCRIRVESAAAMRALCARDGGVPADASYQNTATLTGVIVACPTSPACPGNPPLYCLSSNVAVTPSTGDCTGVLLCPLPCNFRVIKEVKCVGDADTAYAALKDALPGSVLRFRVRIENPTQRFRPPLVANCVKLPRFAIRDAIDVTWARSNFTAQIVNCTSGAVVANVASCFTAPGPDFMASVNNGFIDYTFAECRPATPWLAPGECLELTFDVTVPSNFGTQCTAIDATNTVQVAGFTEVCPPPPPNNDVACHCDEDAGQPRDPRCPAIASDFTDGLLNTARINVRVPCLRCEKSVSATGSNGHVPYEPIQPFSLPASSNLQLPSDILFPLGPDGVVGASPLQLNFTIGAINCGEVPFSGVQICDDNLVADVNAVRTTFPGEIAVGTQDAGLTCDLCNGACDGTNDLCRLIGDLGFSATCPGEVRIDRTCQVRVFSRRAWEAFAMRRDSDRTCYQNTGRVTGDINAAGICPPTSGLNRSTTCDAQVCLEPCYIAVRKEVRCLPNCSEAGAGAFIDADLDGNLSDTLKVAPGSCIQYRVVVTNNAPADNPVTVCALRYDDIITCRTNFASPLPFDVVVTRSDIGGALALNPPLVLRLAAEPVTPSDLLLSPPLPAGASVTLTFKATIVGPATVDANCDPQNTILVCCATQCPAGETPVFRAPMTAVEPIDIQRATIACSKDFAIRRDTNCDGTPDGAFTAFTNNLDLRDEIFPLTLRLRVTARNTGQVCLNATVRDDVFENCIRTIPGLDFEAGGTDCTSFDTAINLCPDNGAAGGPDEGVFTCDIRVCTAQAMRDLCACIDPGATTLTNTATVVGRITGTCPGGCPGTICTNDNGNIEVTSTCTATITCPVPCEFNVVKEVRCASTPPGSFGPSVNVIPGQRITFRVRVSNTSDPVTERTKLPRFAIRDDMSCAATWTRSNLRAQIVNCTSGVLIADVTSCFANPPPPGQDFLSSVGSPGTPRFYTFCECRAASPWLAPGECLELLFDVDVPNTPDVFACGTPIDCSNFVSVEGFTETAAPTCDGVADNACFVDNDAATNTANVDVRVPRIACDKSIAGTVTLEGGGTQPLVADAAGNVDIPSNFTAVTLDYTFTVTNTGETALTNVQICDTNLIANAIAAGATVDPGSCQLCTGPCNAGGNDGCALIGNLDAGSCTPPIPPGSTATRTCRIVIPSVAVWDLFEALDGADDDCYNNNATVSGQVNAAVGGLCITGTPPIVVTSNCSATACVRRCRIDVRKAVRCVPNCTLPTTEVWHDDEGDDPRTAQVEVASVLQVGPSACVQYRIRICNSDTRVPPLPICELRIDDCITNIANFVGGIGNISITRTDMAGGVTVAPPFNWHACGGAATPSVITLNPPLPADQCVVVTFTATVAGAGDVNPANDPDNRAFVECKGVNPNTLVCEPAFCCQVTENEPIDIVPASLECVSKQYAVLADMNADCVVDNGGVFDGTETYTDDLNLRDKIFPVKLRMRVQAHNTGQIPLNVTVTDAPLCACLASTPGVTACGANDVCGGVVKLVAPGATVDFFQDICIATDEAARALDNCDGAIDNILNNVASLSGVMTAGGGGVCVGPNQIVVGDNTNCDARIRLPLPCILSVTKQVRLNVPGGTFGDSAIACAGDALTFRITIRNDSGADGPRLARLCITDLLNCNTWVVPGSLITDLAGTPANGCFGGFIASLNTGLPRAYTFAACRPAAPWLAPGETATIDFNVVVPNNFAVVGNDPDCVNRVIVDGHNEACPNACADTALPPPPGVCRAEDSAQINVLVPDIVCSKLVQWLQDPLGSPPGQVVSVDAPAFPLTLRYTFSVTNTGEADLHDVCLWDENLLEHLADIGVSPTSCELDPSENCGGPGTAGAFIGDLAPGASVTKTCEVTFNTDLEWNAFIGLELSFTNVAQASGLSCGTPAQRVTSDACIAIVLGRPILCTPRILARFRFYNENEQPFEPIRGRCFYSWEQQLVSRHSPINYFLRDNLATDAGMVRISGGRTDDCRTIFHRVPFIGVYATVIEFRDSLNQLVKRDMAGGSLVGSGGLAGRLIVPVEPAQGGGAIMGPPDLDPSDDGTTYVPVDDSDIDPEDLAPRRPGIQYAGGPDLGNPAPFGLFGSVLIYTKVEIKWQDLDGDTFYTDGEPLIQDTFITLNNNATDATRIALYFVNGDPLTCVRIDDHFLMTRQQPVYWSAFSGLPGAGVPRSSLGSVLISAQDGGESDTDPNGAGVRVVRGYLVVVAVNYAGEEIKWNYLSGQALIVNYRDHSVWNYQSWPFRAVPDIADGEALGTPGFLDFDGAEYTPGPDYVLLQFYASDDNGSPLALPPLHPDTIDTDLTLFGLCKNLIDPGDPASCLPERR